MFHCDLFSKASISTPLRHRLAKIESDHNEYAIDFIPDAKVDNWPSRRGLYLQILTHFVGYYVPGWMLLEQVDMIVNNYLFFIIRCLGSIFPNTILYTIQSSASFSRC